jgi:CheY-like chemotaxis protein
VAVVGQDEVRRKTIAEAFVAAGFRAVHAAQPDGLGLQDGAPFAIVIDGAAPGDARAQLDELSQKWPSTDIWTVSETARLLGRPGAGASADGPPATGLACEGILQGALQTLSGSDHGEFGGKMTSRGRVLVLDDEPVVCRLIAKFLEHDGHSVLACWSEEEALDALRGGGPFDLIIADLSMLEAAGPALIGKMREQYDDLLDRLVLTTGWADVKETQAAAYSLHPVLNKPFGAAEVCKHLRRALVKRDAERA